MDKKAFRKEVRKRFDSFEPSQYLAMSAAIRRNFESWPIWQAARLIISFYPSFEEPNIVPLLERAIAMGHTVGLVRIPDDQSRVMEVRMWDGAESTLESHPSLPLIQPAHTLPLIAGNTWQVKRSAGTDVTPLEHPGLVLVPGLGFGADGGRLGHGNGWYDRFLATHPGLLRVGVSFAFQLSEHLPHDQWDQNMDYLVNESGILHCQRTEP